MRQGNTIRLEYYYSRLYYFKICFLIIPYCIIYNDVVYRMTRVFNSMQNYLLLQSAPKPLSSYSKNISPHHCFLYLEVYATTSLHPAIRDGWSVAFCSHSAGLHFEWHMHHLPQRSGPASPWKVHCWPSQAVRVQQWGPSCLAAQGAATAPLDSLITPINHRK